MNNVCRAVAAIVLLLPVPVTWVTYTMDFKYAAYIVGKYPIYEYVLSDVVAAEAVIALLVVSGAGIMLSWFVAHTRSVLYTLSMVYILYTLNVLTLIIENEFFGCGCGLFYKTARAPMHLAAGFSLSVIAILLLRSLRRKAPRTMFGGIYDLTPDRTRETR